MQTESTKMITLKIHTHFLKIKFITITATEGYTYCTHFVQHCCSKLPSIFPISEIIIMMSDLAS
jgi:hypothetical protein